MNKSNWDPSHSWKIFLLCIHIGRFREHCNQCLTEAVATVLPVSWVIHLVGEKIQSLDTWNDLDAAVFILTGVAPRAPAGQDNVIPKLIEYIPRFPYPQVGLPALLLRISAGRLILYTAGYLSFKPDALVPTLKFLLSRVLTYFFLTYFRFSIFVQTS